MSQKMGSQHPWLPRESRGWGAEPSQWAVEVIPGCSLACVLGQHGWH